MRKSSDLSFEIAILFLHLTIQYTTKYAKRNKIKNYTLVNKFISFANFVGA